MLLPLQESVNVAAVNAAGWAVALGSIALVVAWLNHLYR
jgi:cell division inhibitor SulA